VLRKLRSLNRGHAEVSLVMILISVLRTRQGIASGMTLRSTGGIERCRHERFASQHQKELTEELHCKMNELRAKQ
jgi:hypothetical protein